MTAKKLRFKVDEEMLTVLKQLKKENDLKSYSDALRKVLQESKTLRRSERGSLPKLKPFVREKHDRFDRFLGVDRMLKGRSRVREDGLGLSS